MAGPRLTLLGALERLDESTFAISGGPSTAGRLLGSGLIAASVLAASATVAGSHRPVGLHTTFVRAGRAGAPVRLRSTAVHDGRSTVVRSVQAIQRDRVLATSTIRFHDEPSDDHDWQVAPAVGRPAPGAGRPEDSVVATMALLADFEIRAAVAPGSVERRVLHPYWIRSTAAVPDLAAVHEALVGLLTDIGVSGSAWPPGTPFRERRRAVSLDHALWWHRPPRIDEWLCFDAEPLVNHAGRGVARGTVHDERGRLVASFSQEVLLRAL